MKLLKALYLTSFLVSGALAVSTTEDVTDSDKRDLSTENFQISEASQPGAGNAADVASVLGRDANGENEFADASEVEARNAKKKKRGKRCGKKGKKCVKRGRKNRKGKKKAKKAKKVKTAKVY